MGSDMSRMVGLGIASRLVATLWLVGLLVGVALPGCSLTAERRQPAVLILLPGQPAGVQTSIDSFAAAARASLVDAARG